MKLTSSEWIKVKQAAEGQWPGEMMSSGELCRRYVLAGVEALKNVADEDKKRMQYQFQATMTALGERDERRSLD
jgi:hypothetical protein